MQVYIRVADADTEAGGRAWLTANSFHDMTEQMISNVTKSLDTLPAHLYVFDEQPIPDAVIMTSTLLGRGFVIILMLPEHQWDGDQASIL